MTRLLLQIAFAAVLGASPLHAQRPDDGRGPFLGLGAGMGMVHDGRYGEQGAGPILHVRAGWRLARAVTLMLEGGGYRMLDESLPSHEAATPHVLKTSSLLASVQVGLPRSFFVRPGIGMADHGFAVSDPFPNDDVAMVAHETRPAAGLALGRTMVVARVVPVAIEGVALWSRGSESTGTRWSAGIQAVALLRWPSRGAR